MKRRILIKLVIISLGIILAINLCTSINSRAGNDAGAGQYYYPKGYRILSLCEGKSPNVLTLTAIDKRGKVISLWYEEGNTKPFKEIVFNPK